MVAYITSDSQISFWTVHLHGKNGGTMPVSRLQQESHVPN